MSSSLTPISRCSVKLRRILEIEEEEALRFRIRVRRQPANEKQAKNQGGRWFREPKLGVPGPFGERPTSPLGHVSFHYGITVVSRGADGKSIVSDSRGRVSETERTPGDHDEYVARPGAVMTIGPAEYDQYATRSNVTDLTTGKPEAALISNISLDPRERATFWNAVHANARKAGSNRLVLDPKRGSKKEWKALAAAEEVPADIRQIAAEFVAGDRTSQAELPMQEAEAKAVIELICRFVPNADRKKGPVRFVRKRNGRTQYRLEAELPDGIDNAARMRLMIRMAEAVEATGAMYTVTVHEPDEHNDDRNYHLHLVAHDRPAKLINGQWDFTIPTRVKRQSGRVRYSERKNKIVLDHLKSATNRGDFQTFLKVLRREFAEFCNEELRAAGRTRLFDPRKYTEMGIDRKPTKPLGTRLAPLEAVGVPTGIGTSNAEIIWTYELQSRLRRCEADRLARAERLAELQDNVERLLSSGPNAHSIGALLDRARDGAALLDIVEPELAEYEVTLKMARARPAKVADTCSRILKEIEAGGGSSSDQRNRHRIAQRKDDAAAFLAKIDEIDRVNQKVILGQQPAIVRARLDLAAVAELAATMDAVKPIEVQAVGEAPMALPPEHADRALEPAPDAGRSPSVQSGSPVISLDAVIARIREDRLQVLGPEYHGGHGYRAAKISRQELRVLQAPDSEKDAQLELARIAKQQAEEIDGAHLLLKSIGRARAEELAARSSGRPSAGSNPLGVLMAYSNHPRVAKLMGWDEPEQERSVDQGPSIWRRMRTSVAQAWNRMEQLDAELVRDVCDEPQPVVVPDLPDLSISAQQARDDAVAKYAAVIRTDPEVEIITVDGQRRVNPASVSGWERSASAWEDHDLVKAAVEDRWAQEQEKVRQSENIDRFRAEKRAEIVAEIAAGRLTATKKNGAWVITGQDADLVFFAQRWRDNPDLVAAFRQSASRGPIVIPQPQPAIAARTQSPALGTSMPAAAIMKAVKQAASQPTAPEGYSVADQRRFLERGGQSR